MSDELHTLWRVAAEKLVALICLCTTSWKAPVTVATIRVVGVIASSYVEIVTAEAACVPPVARPSIAATTVWVAGASFRDGAFAYGWCGTARSAEVVHLTLGCLWAAARGAKICVAEGPAALALKVRIALRDFSAFAGRIGARVAESRNI